MASKPAAYGNQLHFFPGVHRMIWFGSGQTPMIAEAWGGEEPAAGARYDIMKPQTTTPGHYVIYSFAPYRTNTWPMSRLRWGTRLRVDRAKNVVLYETGSSQRPWAPVSERVPGITIDAIKQYYHGLFGPGHTYDADHDDVPDQWVFNDFGPWAVRYFVDKNRNKRLDAGESLSGEMIHTTPDTEGQVSQGKPAALVPSHGCIHVSPVDRDRLHAAGAFERGVDLIIHRYDETVPSD